MIKMHRLGWRNDDFRVFDVFKSHSIFLMRAYRSSLSRFEPGYHFQQSLTSLEGNQALFGCLGLNSSDELRVVTSERSNFNLQQCGKIVTCLGGVLGVPGCLQGFDVSVDLVLVEGVVPAAV